MDDHADLFDEPPGSVAPPGWTPGAAASSQAPTPRPVLAPPASPPTVRPTWALFAQTMLLFGTFAVLLVGGAIAGAGGDPLTGLGLFAGGFAMLLASVAIHHLRRGSTGALWIGASFGLIGLGTGMRFDPSNEVFAAAVMSSVGVTITIVFGAALAGALAARQESWTLTLSIGACGATVLAWLVAYSEYGPPSSFGALAGALCGALAVTLFLAARERAPDRDAVWLATHVLVLMFAVLVARGGAGAVLGRSGGPTARPKVGAFRKL